MAKDLRAILRKYASSKREGDWLDKHAEKLTLKTGDKPSENDAHFNTTVPMFNRHIEHGYNPGEDEAASNAMAVNENRERLARIKRALFEDKDKDGKDKKPEKNKYEKHKFTQKGDKVSDYKEKESKGSISRSWTVSEGRIKELDTKEKEEKRTGKKVLSNSDRKKLSALKKKDK